MGEETSPLDPALCTVMPRTVQVLKLALFIDRIQRVTQLTPLSTLWIRVVPLFAKLFIGSTGNTWHHSVSAPAGDSTHQTASRNAFKTVTSTDCMNNHLLLQMALS